MNLCNNLYHARKSVNIYFEQDGLLGAPAHCPGFDGNSGVPISDPARFCWNLNTRRAGSRFANPSFARKQLWRTGAMQNRGRSSLSHAPASRRSGAVGGCTRGLFESWNQTISSVAPSWAGNN
jgi:hypothetical protein